jgi:hypothetical protein
MVGSYLYISGRKLEQDKAKSELRTPLMHLSVLKDVFLQFFIKIYDLLPSANQSIERSATVAPLLRQYCEIPLQRFKPLTPLGATFISKVDFLDVADKQVKELPWLTLSSFILDVPAFTGHCVNLKKERTHFS